MPRRRSRPSWRAAPVPDQFWSPEPIFADRTIFILASGPSLTAEVAERVRGRPCIAVNATCPTLAPWATIWFFTDAGLFDRFRPEIAAFPGLVVTLSRRAAAEMPARVRRVRGWLSDRFPEPPAIRLGRSTGQTAIGLAVALRARRAVLLGFDMRVSDDGREHHHDAYAGEARDTGIYGRAFLPAFAGWHATARAAGTEVVNATPDSALTEFPMVELDEALRCPAS